MSNNYTPPASKKIKTIEEKPMEFTPDPVAVATSPVTPLVQPVLNANVNAMNLCVDEYIDAINGSVRKTDAELGDIQLSFMQVITKSLTLSYNDYCAFMEYLMKAIKENQSAFGMERRYTMFSYVPTGSVRAETKTRYFNYMEAVITLTNNLQQRHRVARLIDIPALVKGLNPKAQNNISTYFNSLYQ